MLLSSDVAAETRTECTMIERELKARQRALASMCDRVATSVNAGLIDEFIDEFCCGVAQQILRYKYYEYESVIFCSSCVVPLQCP